MDENIIGTFAFRNEGDGCLTSKYYHGGQPHPFVEACQRIHGSVVREDGFDGEYKTVWVQERNRVVHTDLKITWNQASNTYTLTWGSLDTPMFAGTGMIFEELLIGAYWTVPRR